MLVVTCDSLAITRYSMVEEHMKNRETKQYLHLLALFITEDDSIKTWSETVQEETNWS